MKPVEYVYTVRLTVAPDWIADGFDLTDEQALEMLANRLPFAHGHELTAKVIDSPNATDVARLQGGKVRDVLATRKAGTL